MKQIEDMETITATMLTGYDYDASTKTVTLTRKDGTKFSFVAQAADGSKGATGDKGPTGDRGESAYEIAKRLSLTSASTYTAWLSELKGSTGNKGDKGSTGDQGAAGDDGTVPTFSIGTTSWLAAGSTPTLTVSASGSAYTLTFGVPSGADGGTGSAGTKPTLTLGTVTMGTTNGGNAAASLGGTAPAYTLNLTIPRGSKGTDAVGTAGKDAQAPSLTFNVTYLEEDETPTVSYSNSSHSVGSAWTRTVNLGIPMGEQGAKGATATGTAADSHFQCTTLVWEWNKPGTGMMGLYASQYQICGKRKVKITVNSSNPAGCQPSLVDSGGTTDGIYYCGLSWRSSHGVGQIVYDYMMGGIKGPYSSTYPSPLYSFHGVLYRFLSSSTGKWKNVTWDWNFVQAHDEWFATTYGAMVS